MKIQLSLRLTFCYAIVNRSGTLSIPMILDAPFNFANLATHCPNRTKALQASTQCHSVIYRAPFDGGTNPNAYHVVFFHIGVDGALACPFQDIGEFKIPGRVRSKLALPFGTRTYSACPLA